MSVTIQTTQIDPTNKGVTGLPDTPGYTTEQMQHKFDELPLLCVTTINSIVTDLGALALAVNRLPDTIDTDSGKILSVNDDGTLRFKKFTLADFDGDTTHRLVTDSEKTTWSGKANAVHSHTTADITNIPPPTAADAGKSLSVNAQGGYYYKLTGDAELAPPVTFNLLSGDGQGGIEDSGAAIPVTASLLSGDGQGGISNAGISAAQIRGLTADAWNASATYTVGDLRIHNNVLWKCLVANSGQEPVSGSACWSATSVANALVEIGENANGNYIKYSNGILICYRDTRDNRSAATTYTYPHPFISSPVIVTNLRAGQARGYSSPEDVTSREFVLWVSSGTTAVWHQWIAIGRWK